MKKKATQRKRRSPKPKAGPFEIGPRAWAYEEHKGLEIYVAPAPEGTGESVGLVPYALMAVLLRARARR